MNWRKVMPHVVALLVFAALCTVYFAPSVLEGKALRQGDVISGKGWGNDLKEYHEKTGEYAYWSNAMFSGMPCNYAYTPPRNNVFSVVEDIVRLGTTNHDFTVVFIYLIGFYVAMLCFGVGPWLSMVAAVAYAFASYNIIIIEAGHINKAFVMATMAPVLGGIYLCYQRKYLTGVLVTLIATGLNVYWNHQQISYYLLLIILPLAVVYFIYAVREKEVRHFFISSAVLLCVALIAAAPSMSTLIPTMDYSKETMRGGAVLKANADGEKETSGLEIDYAFQWSYGVGESLTVLVPNIYGASSYYNIGKESETYDALRQTGQADRFCKYAPMYWGDQPFTSGPVYFGAVICMLFLFGMIIVKGPERWWILAAIVVSFVLSWGRNFPLVNDWLFYHLPLYNKFRTPAMSLVMANVTMVIMAVLAVRQVIEEKEDRRGYVRPLLISAGVTGGICLLLLLFGGAMFSFSGISDANYPDWLQSALVADRKSMLRSDAFRSLAFIVLSALCIYCYLVSAKIKRQYVVAALGCLILVDLWAVDKRFLNDDHFMPKKSAKEIQPTACDLQILKDTDPNYRVINLSTNTFNESQTSYFHKSVGGYSPVKLRRYQDIIDYHISGKHMNMKVLNMLNTRYFIVPGQSGPMVQRNPDALGNVWFVDNLKWVNSPDEEIVALYDFDPRRTAVIDTVWRSAFSLDSSVETPDSTTHIVMSEYRSPGEIVYDYRSAAPRFAVFSEVYYKTWKAYVDGEEMPLVRVNYILRGMQVPAGKHQIVLKCYDNLMESSRTFSLWASVAVIIIVLGLLAAMVYVNRRKQ